MKNSFALEIAIDVPSQVAEAYECHAL